MNLMLAVLLMFVVIVTCPFVVYVTIKLGTIAFFNGRQFFLDSRRSNNGESCKSKTRT